MLLNAIAMQSKEALTNPLLELIRSGYGLTGQYHRDMDLLYRIRLLEDQIASLNSVVQDYFRNFKQENPYYKKFCIMYESDYYKRFADTSKEREVLCRRKPSLNNNGITEYQIIARSDIPKDHLLFKRLEVLVQDPIPFLGINLRDIKTLILCDANDAKLQVRVNLDLQDLARELYGLNLSLQRSPWDGDYITLTFSTETDKDFSMSPNYFAQKSIAEIIYNQGVLI
jgi:hypothetical protein